MENEALQAYRQRRAAFEATFERHLAAGVVFYSADGILIDDTVEIAPGAVILPGTILRGATKIGAGHGASAQAPGEPPGPPGRVIVVSGK